MSSIFPDDVNEALNKTGNMWIKAAEFTDGLVLQVVRVEKVRPANPKYAAVETDYLVKNEVLEVGESFRYLFRDASGAERQHDSKSAPLCIGFQKAEVEENNWVKITRSGERDETRYDVEKVEAPAGAPQSSKTAPSAHSSAPDTRNLDSDAIDAAFDAASPSKPLQEKKYAAPHKRLNDDYEEETFS